ncbi:MAG: putative peptidoglycan-binding domain-containing protein [Paracoccaceae bacterium]
MSRARARDRLRARVGRGWIRHGVSRAVKFLQGAIGAGPDGIIGPKTRKKIQEANPRDMLRNMLALRIKFYMDLDHLNDIYGLGWSRRSVDVIMDAMDMIAPDTTPETTPSAKDLLAAYINHKDVTPGSPQHTIAGALRDMT